MKKVIAIAALVGFLSMSSAAHAIQIPCGYDCFGAKSALSFVMKNLRHMGVRF